MYDKSLVTKERLAELKVKRDAMRGEHFAEVEKALGKECADAMEYLYSIYNEGMYLWLAGLWDPKIGGFYYSNSARDTEGLLPDVESTAQAFGFMETAGLISSKGKTWPSALPENMRAPAREFAKGLQDPDGYFYHPQWGKDITVSRRGRDLSWALSLVRNLGGTTNYLAPTDKKDQNTDPTTLLPDHLRTIENFRAYLADKDLMHKSYSVGNLMQAQINQIKAAGKEFVDELVSWYTVNQNAELGLWQDEVCYHATNGLMKVALAISAVDVKFPNAENAIKSAVEVILSDKPDPQITSFYNPWITIKLLLDNLTKFGEPEKSARLRAEILAKAPAMIRNTADKVVKFRKDDGSFSYSPNGGTHRSQGALVADPKAKEGDVNGNGLASTGVIRNVCAALEIPVIPFFTVEDSEFFFELIDASYSSDKINPPIVL